MLGIAYSIASLDRQLQELDMDVKTLGSASSRNIVPIVNEEKMVLGKSSGKLIADYLEVPELAEEIKRAVWQVERSLKGKQEYQEEKQEIEAATQKTSQPP